MRRQGGNFPQEYTYYRHCSKYTLVTHEDIFKTPPHRNFSALTVAHFDFGVN